MQTLTESFRHVPKICLSQRHENWKDRLYQVYLNEKGLSVLPDDPRQVADMKGWLHDRGYKPNSIASILAPVRAYYRMHGIETKKIIPNPRRSLFRHLKDPVPLQEIPKLLDYGDTHCSIRDRSIIYLMCFLGLREIEISRLEVGDFFQEDASWWLRVWGKYREEKDEKMLVTNGLLEVIQSYHKFLKDRKIGDPLFRGKTGIRLRPDCISRIVSDILKETGIVTLENKHRITPHSLRHSLGKKILKETGNIRQAQKLMRHTDVRTTEIYAHDLEELRPEKLVEWR